MATFAALRSASKVLQADAGLVMSTRTCSGLMLKLKVDPKQDRLQGLDTKKIPFPRSFEREHCDIRREWVEAKTGADLQSLSTWWDDDHSDTKILKGNIEMPIGTTQLPVAVAGPLIINGTHANGEFHVPMATTQTSLIECTRKGMDLLNACGGVRAWSGVQRMARVPCFVFEDPTQASVFGEWARTKLNILQTDVISKHSKRAVVKDIIPIYDKECVHLMLRYETGDASGQNMTTTCSYHACKWLLNQAQMEIPEARQAFVKYFLEMGLSGDKRINTTAMTLGRGIPATVEVNIPDHLLEKHMNTSSADFVEYLRYARRSSAKTGGIGGFNINAVKGLAAIFAATGQDVACVAECSSASLDFACHRKSKGSTWLSFTMPNLLLGTVGGGTGLPTQANCLDMMDCRGGGKVHKLAEIIASSVLALDITVASALSSGNTDRARDVLSRN